jgi:phage tail sheath protein FI
VEEFSDAAMLNIHQAMLRMAGSRGDLVAILSLPEHFQSRRAIEYKNRLSSVISVSSVISETGPEETKLLSYGAIYHPWPVALEHGTTPVTVPPDGVACGVIAQRSINRGAWVAPANIVVRDVVALAQTYNRLETVRLFEAQINLLTADSRGIVVFNAVTLSEDEELKLLNVRRLLILLRRLAIREGMEITFDPNNESTRRLIERIFERMLTDLYTRGAFTGNTPDQAFRVIVNESNNTRQSIDQGRLVVDLKVAPSQPLKFLTIRLIQGDGESGRVEEIL